MNRCLGGCGRGITGAPAWVPVGYHLCPECQEGADILNRNALALAREENDRLKQSMVDHFKRDHLAGDGPEIDRWKARVQELEAQIETARQLERQACAVEAETKRHAPMTPGGTCCECARWIAGTWPGESDDHADTCSAGKLEHEADYAIARCIRLRRSP